VLVAPASQHQSASNIPHVNNPAIGVFQLVPKWLDITPHETNRHVAGAKLNDVFLVGIELALLKDRLMSHAALYV